MKPVPLKVFLLGMLWAIVYAMAPVGVVIWRWVELWQDKPDMRILGPMAITCAAMGAVGYWRKYSALVRLPPDWAQAREMAQSVTITQTTTATTTATVAEVPPVKENGA